MDNILNKYIKQSSRFLTIPEGITEVFTIQEYTQGIDTLNGKPTIFYKVVLADGQDTEKVFQTSSVGFARQIINLPNQGIGVKVEVSRTGQGLQTKYAVKEAGKEEEIKEEELQEPF